MVAMNPEFELDRVRRHTSAEDLENVEERIQASVRFHTTQPVSAITERIRELEQEWSMERWLETNASALAFTGVVLGVTVSRKWLVLPLLVTGFLFQHAVQGWCPPLPLLRKIGVRTRAEIDREKYALKILRGDFKEAANMTAQENNQADKVLSAVSA